jgi:hypothetical protein
VCLYWIEFRNASIRRHYERRGFRVISHGFRGSRHWPGDADFLPRQLTELRRHRRVASNRLSTAILYGASVGCDVGVYGDPMIIENDHPVYGGVGRIRDLWPDMHDVWVPADVARSFSTVELGIEHVVSPTELAQVCGWTRDDARDPDDVRVPDARVPDARVLDARVPDDVRGCEMTFEAAR